jgi:gliding motility-associated-like protein
LQTDYHLSIGIGVIRLKTNVFSNWLQKNVRCQEGILFLNSRPVRNTFPIKRMRTIWLLLIFLITAFTASAQTADITQGCVPLTVEFTAPVGAGPSHFWIFGDGATSTGENPENIFVTPGTYIVEYSATSAGPVIGTVTINVYEQLVPEFTADPMEGCAPLLVNLTNTTQVGAGVTVTGVSWVFGDGSNASGATPSQWFTAPGSYFVSLEIETNLASCNATEVYNDAIVVTPGPNATFTTNPNPMEACDPPLVVSFTNNSGSPNPITYAWDFGNGNTSTDEDPTAETYTENGNFSVSLTVTDDLGCATTIQRPVNIGSPETEFIIPDTICVQDSIQMINNSSPGFSQWVFAAGNDPVITSIDEPWVHFDTPGLQDVTLTTSVGACSSSQTVQILVEDPSAEFTSTPDYACVVPMDVQFTPVNQGYAEYNWIFGDSLMSTLVNPNHTYIYEDTTIYSWYGMDTLLTELIIVSTAGCIDTVTHLDTLWLPNAVFFPNVAEGCVPLTVTFADSSTSREDIVNWEWHLGDGSVITSFDGSPQSVTYTQPGHYNSYLVIENAAGCTDTSYNVTTIVGDQLTPDFAADVAQVCPGDPIQFTNQTALSDSVDYWHYYSETNRQFHCFDEPNPTWQFTNETGLQDVTLIVGWNGCFSSTTINDIIQVDGPIAEIFFNCECETPYEVAFENRSHDITSFEWDFGDGNTSTDPNPVHIYAATGDYTVSLTTDNTTTGCPTSVDTAPIFIRDIQAQFQSDSILCQGVPSPFDASMSTDVYNQCWNGYTWQFDDPTRRPITTTDPSYPIDFQNSGNFGVTLITTDINGCTDTARGDVSVYGIDAAYALSDNNICAPSSIDFTDQTVSDTTISSWAWAFGDLTIGSDQNPTHEYMFFQDSLFTQLIVENIVGCVDTVDSVLVTMYSPISNISSNPFFANICEGRTVNFTASDYTQGGSNLTFDWDFQDGGTSTDQNPAHQFDDEGTYVVNMVFTEISTGCIDSTTRTVNVQAFPIAGFTSGDSLPVFCAPANATFTDTTISSVFHTRTWDFGNGFSASNNPASTAYSTSGDFTVEMIATTSYGCADTATVVYSVIAPEGSFSIDEDTICRGEEITFTLQDTSEVYSFVWDFGDGTSTSNQNPISHTYTFVPPNGSTVGKLVVSGLLGGCPDESTVPIYIHEVVADFIRNDGIDTALCFQPYQITNQSLNSDVFFWDFGFGANVSDEQPGFLNFPSPGTYNVILGVASQLLGCNDTIMKTVVLHPNPEIFSRGDTICEGETGQIQVLNPEVSSDYTWTSIEPVSDANAVITTSSPLITAEYEIAVLDTNGCSDIDTTQIRVINPLILSDWDTTIVIGDSICLPINAEAGLYMFDWSPTEGLDCDTCGSPCIRPLELITYSVSVTDILGCFTSEADYTIDIYPETFLSMPTTFTPNGDGANDIITVEGWGIKELVEFRIFNRWGEEIFLSTDEETGWDGYYKGVLQNNDVYAYKITAYTWRDEIKTLEGYINLMR